MRLAYLQLAAAMALVGANIPVAKAAIPFIPVFIFSLIRYGVSVAVLAPFIPHESGGRFSDLSRSDWGYITLQALCGGLLYMVFMLYGLQYTSAMTAGIITSTVPLCVALLALILLGERLGLLTGAALILAMLGILVVNTASPSLDVAPWPLLGNALVGTAVIAESLFVILARKMASSLAPCPSRSSARSTHPLPRPLPMPPHPPSSSCLRGASPSPIASLSDRSPCPSGCAPR